ncbi:MAG: 3-deoxy-7-phosphoheptulonate synthase [Holophaga sp.]|nr:3-deoxy-7-phosphoheptulonate synthase [Holophaga sp.]
MIVKLFRNDAETTANVTAALEAMGAEVRFLPFPFGCFLAGLGLENPPLKKIQAMPGVEWAKAAGSKPILAAREQNPHGSLVPLGKLEVGGEALALVAGPCSVEDREQIFATARFVAAYGATALRGGAYKPRTSPYAFQGLGQAGVELLKEAGDDCGLPVVTEVMDPADVAAMAPFVDCFQIGARNMSNGPLLKAVGRAGKPVLLKRGPSATLAEFVLAAEYILLEGNAQVILCERGIRTFETATRNTLDLNAIPVLKGMTHLPVVVDPSHGTGRRDAVAPMARAAVAAGADGIVVEVHPDPAQARSDGEQSLHLPEFRRLAEELRPVAEAVGRRLDLPETLPFAPNQVPLLRRSMGWGGSR